MCVYSNLIFRKYFACNTEFYVGSLFKYLLLCLGSHERSAFLLIFLPLYKRYLISLTAFRFLSLSLFLCNLLMICFGVVFSVFFIYFILLSILDHIEVQNREIFGHFDFIEQTVSVVLWVGKIWGHYYFKFLSPFLSWGHMCRLLEIVPQPSGSLATFFQPPFSVFSTLDRFYN